MTALLDLTATDDLRLLAEERILESEALLIAELHSGAFYLAGYAVELGLKAILTKDLTPYSLPDKKAVSDVFIHDLAQLAKHAGVDVALAGGPAGVSWGIVSSKWNVESRYRMHSIQEATDMVASAKDVLGWLASKW